MAARKYEGNIPADGVLVAETDVWQLYERPGLQGWRNFKLVSKVPCVIKANFHLGWDGKRLAGTRDGKALKQHMPVIYEWIIVNITTG